MKGQTSALLSRDGQAVPPSSRTTPRSRAIDKVLWMMNPANYTAVSIPPDAPRPRAGLMIQRTRAVVGFATPARQAAHHAAGAWLALRAQSRPGCRGRGCRAKVQVTVHDLLREAHLPARAGVARETSCR
ncbi:hypothetical protein [Nonomuraea dietziae]|uniref:hypothetical protein n=1 Tax=Nonomuraea dietziae TaxID=65515 RepID=UPI0031E494FB